MTVAANPLVITSYKPLIKLEAVSAGQKRVLLVMATGTGKPIPHFKLFGAYGKLKIKTHSVSCRPQYPCRPN